MLKQSHLSGLMTSDKDYYAVQFRNRSVDVTLEQLTLMNQLLFTEQEATEIMCHLN